MLLNVRSETGLARAMRLPKRSISLAALAVVVLVAGCAGGGEADTSTTRALWEVEAPPVPDLGAERVEVGGRLYAEKCAACHGADLEGQPDWKISNEDGSYPAPPHDASGHTWHHSDRLLVELIRDGLDLPESRMPSFGDQLSDDEILSILDFIKSNWGKDERGFQWQMTYQEQQREATESENRP